MKNAIASLLGRGRFSANALSDMNKHHPGDRYFGLLHPPFFLLYHCGDIIKKGGGMQYG